MKNYMQLAKYKYRFAWRQICHFLGFCHGCGEAITRLPGGNVYCPFCGRR